MAGDNPDDLHVRTTTYSINYFILAIKAWKGEEGDKNGIIIDS